MFDAVLVARRVHVGGHRMRFSSIFRVATSGARAAQLALIAVLALSAIPAGAQGSLGEGRRQAKRSELEQAAKATEQAAIAAPDAKTRERLVAEAASIRQRLRNGDFLPGDRIYLIVLGDSALTDTFTVRGDRKLSLPNIPDVSLAGVLDSELATHLTAELAKYLKSPTVTASAMVRLTLTGGIARNGFQTFPTDQAITDVIMTSGGFGSNAKFEETEIKRSGKVIINKREFQDAIRQGRTVGDLALRDGDEIYMPVTVAAGSRSQGVLRVMAVIGPLFWIVRLIVRNQNP